MDLRPTSNAAAAPKIRQPEGLFSGGWLAALLLSQRALRLSSFVAPCQPPPENSAPIPYFDMGSKGRNTMAEMSLALTQSCAMGEKTRRTLPTNGVMQHKPKDR